MRTFVEKILNAPAGSIVIRRPDIVMSHDNSARIRKIFEEMGGTYVRCGDYFIPNLTLPEEEQRFIGVWGQRHLRYLKEYSRSVYLNLLTSGRLNDYLAGIEEQAQKRFERIVEQMAESEGITEQLKATDQVAWVGEMNNIWSRAREVVNAELIYN